MSFFHLSLRSRMTLAVTGFVLVLMLVTAVFTITLFKSHHEQHLNENQETMVSLLADSIDSAIRLVQTAMINNARAFPEDALTNPAKAQAWLDSRTGLKTQFFTTHLFLVTPDIHLLAMTPHLNNSSVSNPVVHKAIKETFLTGIPRIAGPVPCCEKSGENQIIFTAPVERNGSVALVLAGSFNPAAPNVLSRYMQHRTGANGFVRLINSNNRIVMHTDPKRINRSPVPEVASATGRAFKQGIPVTLRHNGVSDFELMTTLQRLKSVDWLLASSYSMSDTNRTERTVITWFAVVTALGSIFAVVIVFLMMRFLTRPLEQLADHLSALSSKKGDERFINIPVNGEIERLTGAFNSMVKEIDTSTEALVKSEHRYRLVLDHSNDFIFWLRPDGSFEFVSPACLEITGYSQDELYADPSIMNSMVYPADRVIFEDSDGNRTVSGFCGKREVEYQIITKDGTLRWVRHNCSAIYDSDNRFLGRRGSICDISDKKHLADQVSHLVMHDILTGLPNRSLFSDRLEVALSQTIRDQKLLVVMFFGLDRFKLINDTKGHEAGDSLLIMTAERLRRQLHPEDTICRFGGDVFSFILPSRDSKHEAVSMAYLILAALTEPFVLQGAQSISITGSIGIAICPTDGHTSETLIKNAETAMYEAKKHGKNTFRFYTNTMNELAAEMLALDNSMPTSLANGDFYIHFQPQYDFATDSVAGVEALLRWRHPKLGFIGPDRFIPLAEESGFIIKLGAWVLKESCRINAGWISEGLPPMRVAVNISARQFLEPDFIDQVSAALADSSLTPELLEIELTESMLVADEEQVLKKLITLKNMGIHLSIDDFGTGYSSLSYLKHFPLDRLKIDKSFVNDILTDPDDAAITDAIIAMSHALKLKVIAEGVETVSQLAFLRDRGCDEIQGYYISKPLAENDLVAFIKGRSAA